MEEFLFMSFAVLGKIFFYQHIIINHFYSRSKMYSLLRADGVEKKTAKGVNRSYQEKFIRHQNYRDCLASNLSSVEKITSYSILSRNHNVYTVKQEKKGLSPFNDKKFFRADGKSFSFGHKDIKFCSFV